MRNKEIRTNREEESETVFLIEKCDENYKHSLKQEGEGM